MNSIIFTVEIACYMLWQCIRYGLGRPRLDCIKYIAMFLTKRNILYSKIFQTLATSISALRVDEIKFLSQYNDNVPYSAKDVYPIEEIMDKMNAHSKSLNISEITLNSLIPINSGIIALVYCGRLGDKEIVLKVKRRNIDDKLREGIHMFEHLVQYCKYLPYLNKLNIDVIFQENKAVLLRQLDFKNEVDIMTIFKKKYRNTSYVHIPTVYPEYTLFNPEVILMEKVTGHRLQDTSFRSNEQLKTKFGYLLAKYSIRSLFYDRLYHADLHAGNIFFNDDNPDELKICIIDFGITGELTKEYQNYFYLFFTNVVAGGNKMEAANTVLQHFTTPKDTMLNMSTSNKTKLLLESCDVIKLIFEIDCQFDAKMIYLINKTLGKYGLTLNRNFCRIQMSMAVCSSVCNELCKGETKYIDQITHATKKLIDSSDSFFDTE